MSLLKVNQIVPLVAIVECPAGETVYIRAQIRDKDNAVLATLGLADQGNGEFTNYSYLMPDEPVIKVVYEAFEDAGFNTPSSIFCPDNETYSRLDIDKAQAIKTDHLVGLVRGTRLFGKVNNEQKKLIGMIRQPELFGIIRVTNRLIGVISNESLSGSLK